MLCEISTHGNLLTTWIALCLIAVVFTGGMSAWLFHRYYSRPTFEQWQRKSNPAFPPPVMVKREILTMLKGIAVAAFPPALALWLVQTGWSKAYCGVGDYGWAYLVGTFFLVWIATDFVEFYYHRLGHKHRRAWREHKAHHAFFNPTPFAVIADGSVDQFFRATPMLIFPLVMPINIDMLFFTFALFFYGYGVYLHWGYELRWPDAHHPWINTSFQHYLHHAHSTLHKPYSTGFFFKLWDQLFRSEPNEAVCSCAKCATLRGERTRAAFDAVEKRDYSVLLRPAFWLGGPGRSAPDEPARDGAVAS